MHVQKRRTNAPLHVHTRHIRFAILFRAECYPTTQAQKQKLAVAEMRMLRWTCGHTKMDRIRNEEIKGKLRVASISDKLREARLRWFGHVQRRSPDVTVRRCELLDLGAYRRDRGHSKKRWMDKIRQDIKLLGISEELAWCRERWREKISVINS